MRIINQSSTYSKLAWAFWIYPIDIMQLICLHSANLNTSPSLISRVKFSYQYCTYIWSCLVFDVLHILTQNRHDLFFLLTWLWRTYVHLERLKFLALLFTSVKNRVFVIFVHHDCRLKSSKYIPFLIKLQPNKIR